MLEDAQNLSPVASDGDGMLKVDGTRRLFALEQVPEGLRLLSKDRDAFTE